MDDDVRTPIIPPVPAGPLDDGYLHERLPGSVSSVCGSPGPRRAKGDDVNCPNCLATIAEWKAHEARWKEKHAARLAAAAAPAATNVFTLEQLREARRARLAAA